MAKPTKAQKRKKTVQRVIAIVAVVLVAGLAGTLYVRQRVQRSVTAQSGSNVKSVTVTTGSIKTTVSGSGSLTSDTSASICGSAAMCSSIGVKAHTPSSQAMPRLPSGAK